MEIKIYTDYETLSDAVANAMVDLIKQKPNAVICFASGHTPLLTCQLFVQKIKEQKISISQVSFIGLDEWVGVKPENEGSCHYFLYNTIFNPLGIEANQIHVFDAMANNESDECKKMDSFIESRSGIDLMIVGIGMNGHIGFNEPGVSFKNYSHVIHLDETTLSVGQKYFSTATNISKGITLGLQHLMEARQVILIANGEKKAAIIKQAIEETVSEQLPATIMQTHFNSFIMLDEAASSLLKKTH
jgi:galactosamine-6-phosphate isomerase